MLVCRFNKRNKSLGEVDVQRFQVAKHQFGPLCMKERQYKTISKLQHLITYPGVCQKMMDSRLIS